MPRMLVEKIPFAKDLVKVQLCNELHVCACLNICSPHLLWAIGLRPIEALPRREGCAHWRANEQHWLGLLQDAPCFVSL